MTNIKAILFDYDGTLRNSKKLIYDSLDYAFRELDLPAPSEDDLAPHIHHHSYVHQALASEVPYESFDNTYMQKVTELLPTVGLFDGVEELLKDLHAKGYKIALVTAARQAADDLQRLGIAQYFDVLVTAADISKHKPDPEGLNLALERLQVAPNEAVYVGDMVTDMYAAQAAKLRAAIGVTIGLANRRELQTAQADYIIDSLAELPAIITKLEQ